MLFWSRTEERWTWEGEFSPLWRGGDNSKKVEIRGERKRNEKDKKEATRSVKKRQRRAEKKRGMRRARKKRKSSAPSCILNTPKEIPNKWYGIENEITFTKRMFRWNIKRKSESQKPPGHSPNSNATAGSFALLFSFSFFYFPYSWPRHHRLCIISYYSFFNGMNPFEESSTQQHNIQCHYFNVFALLILFMQWQFHLVLHIAPNWWKIRGKSLIILEMENFLHAHRFYV